MTLADVVDERCLGEADREIRAPAARECELLRDAGDPLGVTFGAGVLGVELAREGAQPIEAAVVLRLVAGVAAVELDAVAEGCIAAGCLGVNESDLGQREQLVGAADVLEVADACRGGDGADPFDRGGGEGAPGALGSDPAAQTLGLREDPAEVVGRQP